MSLVGRGTGKVLEAGFLGKACVAAPPVTIMSMVELPGMGEHTAGVSDVLISLPGAEMGRSRRRCERSHQQSPALEQSGPSERQVSRSGASFAQCCSAVLYSAHTHTHTRSPLRVSQQ